VTPTTPSDDPAPPDTDRLTRWRRSAALVAVLAAAAVAVVATNRVRLDRETRESVEALVANAEADPGPDGRFSEADLEGLPDPVRTYLGRVIEDGRPYVRRVDLRQRGTFRVGDASSPWNPLAARQTVTVHPPGFVWRGRVDLSPFLPVRVVDSYLDGRGSLRALLLSTVPVADPEGGPELDEAELTRYLGEAVWFPTALLPREGVEWEAIDDRTARAVLDHREATASLVFRFDDDGLVERVSTPGRYREVDGQYVPTPWSGSFDDYRERDGFLVPVEAATEWNLPEGDLRYWRATVEDIDYHPRAGEGPAEP
jgi:hypothetical protein